MGKAGEILIKSTKFQLDKRNKFKRSIVQYGDYNKNNVSCTQKFNGRIRRN